MARGSRFVILLAAVCLLAGACARFDSAVGLDQAAEHGPAIALAIPEHGLLLVDPATGRARTLADGLTSFQDGFPAWSPDHSHVAFGLHGLVVVDPATGERVTLDRRSGASMPAWAPDGTQLAYGDGVSMWITPADRASPRRVKVPATLAPLDMTWSSAGLIGFEGLALDCSAAVRCSSTGASEIWSILPDGTSLTRLTAVGHAQKPKWSPDGARILFVRGEAGAGPGGLWSAYASGSGASPLVHGSDVVAADWSPDGRQLAVVRTGAANGTLQLWIGNSDGSSLRPVGGPLTGTDATIDW